MELPLEAQLMIVAKILGAMLLGGAIGFEREMLRRPAGLRTHMLVAGASAMFPLTGPALVRLFLDDTILIENIRADPFRVVEAVVTGIAFLGAGTILRRQDGSDVKGLTTAGSLLLSGGVGLCVAIELWVVAVSIAVVTVVTLQTMARVEVWVGAKPPPDGPPSR